jgi:protein-S-isoprenylcysteine O-methyltransferase Ste14
MLKTVALSELFLCWILWACAFVKARKQATGAKTVARAPASKWGIFLVMIGFMLVFSYLRPIKFEKPAWSLIVSMVLGPPSLVLAWSATRHLGKQWRYEAALREDHELIQTGPYRWVRHPIYTSMLGMLLSAGFAGTWWPLLVGGVLFFLAGTEIRIRSEERLLAERFPDSFADYRSRVGALLPFIH